MDDSHDRAEAVRARQEPRRRELLDAAMAYVMQHGLDGLSIRPLAAALGIGHRTLLYYFGSKEELIAEIFLAFRAHDRHVLDVNSAVLVSAEPGRAIGAVWDAMSAPEQSGYWRFFFEAYGHAVREPERYRDFLDGIVLDWLALIGDHLVAAGVADRERASALATLTLAAFRGLLLDLVATGDRDRTSAAARALAETLITARP
ncbi:TetR/AcrR family transcriptional regulator [Streptomyces sp. NPDC001980]|uniref:TetR/AcrR family transcriptional regulator n=1 Tax=Streptomyces sp. NPDC001980 TaxID=3157126 RepID=UPI00331E4C63